MAVAELEPAWKRHLSTRVLTTEGAVNDARHELHRAGNDRDKLAAWASKWAENALDAALLAVDREDVDNEEFEEFEDLEKSHEQAIELSEEAEKLLDNAMAAIERGQEEDDLEAAAPHLTEAIEHISSALEKLEGIGQ